MKLAVDIAAYLYSCISALLRTDQCFLKRCKSLPSPAHPRTPHCPPLSTALAPCSTVHALVSLVSADMLVVVRLPCAAIRFASYQKCCVLLLVQVAHRYERAQRRARLFELTAFRERRADVYLLFRGVGEFEQMDCSVDQLGG